MLLLKVYDNAKNGVSCSNTFSQDISTVEKRISNSNQEIFWTDSEVVLAYIRNEAKRFKIFVANRTELIKDHSDNVNGFTSAQNRTLQIMLQGALTHAIKTKLKNGFLVQSFFGIQKKSGT